MQSTDGDVEQVCANTCGRRRLLDGANSKNYLAGFTVLSAVVTTVTQNQVLSA